jgi:hypothetical protein
MNTTDRPDIDPTFLAYQRSYWRGYPDDLRARVAGTAMIPLMAELADIMRIVPGLMEAELVRQDVKQRWALRVPTVPNVVLWVEPQLSADRLAVTLYGSADEHRRLHGDSCRLDLRPASADGRRYTTARVATWAQVQDLRSHIELGRYLAAE